MEELTRLAETSAWMGRARCAGHPEVAEASTVAAALTLTADYCVGCPVRDQCRDYCQEVGASSGLWGGLLRRNVGDHLSHVDVLPRALAGEKPRPRPVALVTGTGRVPKPVTCAECGSTFMAKNAAIAVTCSRRCRERRHRRSRTI
jgi:hypothetical protein